VRMTNAILYLLLWILPERSGSFCDGTETPQRLLENFRLRARKWKEPYRRSLDFLLVCLDE